MTEEQANPGGHSSLYYDPDIGGTYAIDHNGNRIPLIPEPFYYGLFPWLWKRAIGWRDEYGRKAQRLTWEGPSKGD